MTSMKNTNPVTDAYIENAQDFAKPILRHLREIIHEACPDVVETIKWGMPHFEYKGVICSMAAFKEHVAFGFWKEDLIPGMKQYIKEKEAMGSWGRITSLKGLPPDRDIKKFIKVAMELNEKGVKVEKKVSKAKPLSMPDYFANALSNNKKAHEVFEQFSQSNKNEYITWLTDAKTDETREKRLQTAIEWISEGKPRMWKYMK
jgi:uncharacterized protein YdeI (YjbR/CyaY-like superfamily)